jgi:pantoate--beta-alanine ligase
MRVRAEGLRRDGRRIAVVPTMGALHEGHLELVRFARARADIVVLTIFVNPTQFGPNEDLSRYPRDEVGDLAKAAPWIDLAFCPDASAMYPTSGASFPSLLTHTSGASFPSLLTQTSGASFPSLLTQTVVEVRELAKPLCGASRPGHFAGVATVVTKLFHATLPHLAVFGEKDFQQLAIIRRMTRDLDFGIEIASVPIVRERDGLAMSSRNAYLTVEQRSAALCLSRALAAAEGAVARGERIGAAIERAARAVLEAEPLARIDYCELRDAEELTPVERLERPAVLALAVFVGNTRLIDNRVLRASA